MKYLTKKDKRTLPLIATADYKRTPRPDDHIIMGRVEIDNDGCNGCRLCVEVCPASALEMSGKTSVRMVGDNAGCIACGDCVAICLPDVIQITRFQQYDGLYQFIGRGEADQPRCF